MVTCATCNHPVPAGARFCPSCGTGVSRGDAALEERRVVTVAVRRPRRLHVAGRAPRPRAGEAPGGGVLRAPRRRHRAVRRARRQAARRRHRRPVRRPGRPRGRRRAGRARRPADAGHAGSLRRGAEIEADELRMRIGINTGEVLVGTLAGSDYTAMGDVVNTASRLQALAPPGGVLAGSATIALCPPSIHREPFGITRLRGRQQDEQSWLRHRRRRGRHPPGALRRPVRRPRTTSARCSTPPCSWSATATAGSCRSSARPGPGSRAWPTRSSARWRARRSSLRTACAPYGDGNVWAPVVTRHRRRCSASTPTPPPDEVAATVRARAQELWSLDPADPALRRYLDVVGFLLGHDVAARSARCRRRPRRRARHADRDGPPPRRDAHDGAVRRQPAVGRPVAARSPRRHRAHACPTCRSCSSPPSAPTATSCGRRPSSGRSCCRCRSARWTSRTSHGAGLRDLRQRRAPSRPTARSPTLVDRGGGNPLFLVELAALAATCCRQRAARARCGRSSRRASTSSRRRSGRSSTTPPCSAPPTRSARWCASPRRWVRSSASATSTSWRPTACSTSRAGGGGSAARSCARSPTRRSPSGCGPSATPASPPCWPSAAPRSTTSPTTPPRPPSCSPSSARSTASARRSPTTPSSALHEAATAALETGRLTRRHPRTPAGPSTSTRADPTVERGLLLVRAEAELERRKFAEAVGRRRGGARRARWPPATASTRARPAGASAASPRCRATWRRRGASSARRSTCSARPATSAASPTPCGRGASPRCSAARSTTPAGCSTRRWTSTTASTTSAATPGPTRTWPGSPFQAGDFADAEVQLAEAKERFEALGDANGVIWADGLMAYVLYFQRRFDEAEALAVTVEGDARRWADTLGEPDDADAARQPAAVDRPAGRGRAARRAGARRVPRDRTTATA